MRPEAGQNESRRHVETRLRNDLYHVVVDPAEQRHLGRVAASAGRTGVLDCIHTRGCRRKDLVRRRRNAHLVSRRKSPFLRSIRQPDVGLEEVVADETRPLESTLEVLHVLGPFRQGVVNPAAIQQPATEEVAGADPAAARPRLATLSPIVRAGSRLTHRSHSEGQPAPTLDLTRRDPLMPMHLEEARHHGALGSVDHSYRHVPRVGMRLDRSNPASLDKKSSERG